MPLSQNAKECGWFYHAPTKKNVGAPKLDYPAPSNIPGLGFDDPVDVENQHCKEMVFKETDTHYIRLAKMGGRKDLLSFKSDNERQKSAGPRGYPRNDWFYLEDNRMQDEYERGNEEKKSWQFLLPDYMVHQSYKPSFEEPDSRPTRSAAPFYTEVNCGIEEGRHATDKTVKIQEPRKPGFGVRLEKPAATAQKPPPRDKITKPKDSETLQGERKKQNLIVMPTEKEEPTNMQKLLSGDYEKEWYSKLAQMQYKEQANLMKDAPNSNDPQMVLSEKISSANHRRNRTDIQSSYTHKRKNEVEEKEPFVLNRFKNISPKVDSYQRTELMAELK
ncbi:hypothetical protein BgiMline_033939 [Biomphalaria glabrata]|nr:hypothetical protein BgiMline_020152 [Biomphalaria glabrata]